MLVGHLMNYDCQHFQTEQITTFCLFRKPLTDERTETNNMYSHYNPKALLMVLLFVLFACACVCLCSSNIIWDLQIAPSHQLIHIYIGLIYKTYINPIEGQLFSLRLCSKINCSHQLKFKIWGR